MTTKRDKANLMAELFGDSFDDLSESALSKPDKSPILESDKKFGSDSKKITDKEFDLDDDFLSGDRFVLSSAESPQRLKARPDVRPASILTSNTTAYGNDTGKKKGEAFEFRSDPKPDNDIQSSYVATETNISRRRRPPNAPGVSSSGIAQKTDAGSVLSGLEDKGREKINSKPAPSHSLKAEGVVASEVVKKGKIAEPEIYKSTEGIINSLKKQNELQIKTLEDGFNKHLSLMSEMHQKREDFLKEEINKITMHYEGRLESLVKSHEEVCSLHSVELQELRKKHCLDLENIEAYHKRLMVQMSNDHEYFVEHLKSYNDEEIESIKRIQSKESQITTMKDTIVKVEENVEKLMKLGLNTTNVDQCCQHLLEIETLRRQLHSCESERQADVEKLARKLRDCERELAESELKLSKEKQAVSAEKELRVKEKRVLLQKIKNLQKANAMERKKLEEAKVKIVEESRRLLVEFISRKIAKPADHGSASCVSGGQDLIRALNHTDIEIPDVNLCTDHVFESKTFARYMKRLEDKSKLGMKSGKFGDSKNLGFVAGGNDIECRTAGDGGTHEYPFAAWKIEAEEDKKFLDREQEFILSKKMND